MSVKKFVPGTWRSEGLPVDMASNVRIKGMTYCRPCNKLLVHTQDETQVRLFCRPTGQRDYHELVPPEGSRFEGKPLGHEDSNGVICGLVRGTGSGLRNSLAEIDLESETVREIPFPQTIPSWNVWPVELMARTADLRTIYMRVGQLAMKLEHGESNVLYTLRAFRPETGELELIDTFAGPFF